MALKEQGLPRRKALRDDLKCLILGGEIEAQEGKGHQRQTQGKGGSPGSNVEGSVHDHDHLDVQPVPLRGVPSWLVAHKHRILFCICEKRTWGKRGKRKSSQELTGPGRAEVGGRRTKPY